MKVIILAGGSGTRLWPMSRQNKPKQFYNILSDQPLVKDTYERFLHNFSLEDIYISTTPEFTLEIKKIFTHINDENIIVEPEKRDTAPAMGFVAAHLVDEFPDEPIVFVPSDHYITQADIFIKSLRVAEEVILKTKKMVDIGIVPTFPSTALGYTRIGKKVESHDDIALYEFISHTEKPTFQVAQDYLKAGDYLWHANYYMWTPKKFLEVFNRYQKRMFDSFIRIKDLLKKGDQSLVKQEYQKLEKISFDYAITEKMDPQDVLIIRGDFGWSDIGAWDVLYDRMLSKADEHKNVIHANWTGIDTSGSLIYAPSKKIIATIGVDDMIIIDTEDALLICPQGRAQDVKEIVEKLKVDKEEYL